MVSHEARWYRLDSHIHREKSRLNHPRRSCAFAWRDLNSLMNSSIASSASSRCVCCMRSPRLSASDAAVRHAFLICRPLSPRSARRSASSPPRPAFLRNARQMRALVARESSPKWSATWMRERKASSKDVMRFVVRKRMPR